VEIGFVEPREQSVLVAAEHQSKSHRSEESYYGLQGKKESCEVGGLYDVGILIPQLEFIKGEYLVQLSLAA
jgi:hypothetical protein